jgi:hypothetical protein
MIFSHPDAVGLGNRLRPLLGGEGLHERGLDVVVAPGQRPREVWLRRREDRRRGVEIREVLSRENRC